VSGENELQIYVTQDSPTGKNDPEGLQVNIFSAIADPVPEPGTLSLFAISMLGIYVNKKRSAPVQRLYGNKE
jgi:PEP-CTERM motif